MAIPFLTKEKACQFIERLNKIQPTDTPTFGVLNPTKLMRHLRYAFEMSMEKADVKDESNLFTRTFLRILAFHWFTNWPGGKIKAPEYLTPEPEEDFGQERSKLFDTINEFLIEAEKNPNRLTLNPILGKRSLEYWRRIHGLHLNHHCKQYDV